jgi:alpha-L-fucosidase
MSLTLEQFAELRYGMIIHYGLYSLLGRGEWVMNREQIPPEEYRRLADRFTADAYDADALCRLAKRAGMRYMVLTTMHCDGFRLYDTRLSDFSAPKSAARRDLVAELVQACRRHGLYIGLYHGLNQWMDKPDSCDALESKAHYDVFIRQLQDRFRELLTLFNPIDIMVYDAHWPFTAAGWQSEALNKIVRQIQPQILINDRNGLPGDFATPEQHLTSPKPWRPFEPWMTLNDSWGYQPGDHNWKTADQVIAMLAQMAQRRGNLLLNIGLTGDGSAPIPSVRILHTVGDWLQRCGECIYNTDEFTFDFMSVRSDTNQRGDWTNRGPFTARGNTLYLLIRRWTPGSFALGGVQAKVLKATLIGEQTRPVAFQQDGTRVVFTGLPQEPTDPVIPVLKLECDRPPAVYNCGGSRVPKVRHPQYDPFPSDLNPHSLG